MGGVADIRVLIGVLPVAVKMLASRERCGVDRCWPSTISRVL